MSSAPLLPRPAHTTQHAFRTGWILAGTLATASSVGFASWGGYVGKNTGVNEALPQIVAASLFLVASLGCWYGAYHTRHRSVVNRNAGSVQGDDFALVTCQTERAVFKRLIQQISQSLAKDQVLNGLRSDDPDVQAALTSLTSKIAELFRRAQQGDQFASTEAARAALERQVGELRGQLQATGGLQGKLSEAERARDDFQRQLEHDQAIIGRNERQLAELKEANGKLKAHRGMLKSYLAETDSRITRFEQHLSRTRTIIGDLHSGERLNQIPLDNAEQSDPLTALIRQYNALIVQLGKTITGYKTPSGSPGGLSSASSYTDSPHDAVLSPKRKVTYNSILTDDDDDE